MKLLQNILLITALLWTNLAFAQNAPDDFSQVAEKIMPSIVSITTKQKVEVNKSVADIPKFPKGSPFEEFNDLFNDMENNNEKRANAIGSGFIISSDGYIATNNHVISDAEEINITLHDGSKFIAKIVGSDSKTDLAIIKINAKKPLQPIQFGDSSKAKIGEWVLAAGNPFGLGNSISAGIISARGRDINTGPFDDYIQTDAAINRGNSGGPLINLNGEVIGVNTAIYSPSGGSVGIGFAIPSAMAEPIIKQLRDKGQIVRGWIGVKIQEVNEEIADSLGMDRPMGALVAEVVTGSPAEKAGIIKGDVVLSFNGQEIEKMKQLPRFVSAAQLNKSYNIMVLRAGQKQELNITIARYDDKMEKKASKKPAAQNKNTPDIIEFLGLQIKNLDQDARTKYKITSAEQGVVITAVNPTSDAAEKSIRPGDVIIGVNQERITSVTEFLRQLTAAERSGRKSVALLISRKGDSVYIALPLK